MTVISLPLALKKEDKEVPINPEPPINTVFIVKIVILDQFLDLNAFTLRHNFS